MREPGASEVFICLSTFSPASTAFFASSPAASSTLGFEVFVHDVIAAISTSPLRISSPLAGDEALRQFPCRLVETVLRRRLAEQRAELRLHLARSIRS